MHRMGISCIGICVLVVLQRIPAKTEARSGSGGHTCLKTEVKSCSGGGHTCLTCTCTGKTNRNATWTVKFNNTDKLLCTLPINTTYPGSQWCSDVINASHTQFPRNAMVGSVGVDVSNHVTTICVNQTSSGSYTCELDDKASTRIRMNMSLSAYLYEHRLIINCTGQYLCNTSTSLWYVNSTIFGSVSANGTPRAIPSNLPRHDFGGNGINTWAYANASGTYTCIYSSCSTHGTASVLVNLTEFMSTSTEEVTVSPYWTTKQKTVPTPQPKNMQVLTLFFIALGLTAAILLLVYGYARYGHKCN